MSFVIKNKQALDIVDKFLKSLGLEMEEGFPYNPHKVISNLRVSFNSSKYVTTIHSTLTSLSNKEIYRNHTEERNYWRKIDFNRRR